MQNGKPKGWCPEDQKDEDYYYWSWSFTQMDAEDTQTGIPPPDVDATAGQCEPVEGVDLWECWLREQPAAVQRSFETYKRQFGEIAKTRR